jgi:hypothetical protein
MLFVFWLPGVGLGLGIGIWYVECRNTSFKISAMYLFLAFAVVCLVVGFVLYAQLAFRFGIG